MSHLVRYGVLLAPLLVFVFVVPKVIPAPESLEDFGFHIMDAETNAEAWASMPVQYVSSAVCQSCHDDQYGMWEQSNHRTVNCEDCHGPAAKHVETGQPPIVDNSREFCALCHAALVSRPESFLQVDMSEMGGGALCSSCHDPHDPRAGMPPEVPHTLEGRGNCRTCHESGHEPWKRLPPELPHTLEGRSDCLSCHGPGEIRGVTLPRIPHSLEGRSDCLLCHNADGMRPFPEDHGGRKGGSCLTCHRSG